ncbi:hypothetical protein ACP275_12G101900 [Erythranthe tilingii]
MERTNSRELKKGPWTRDEDQKLLAYIQEHGHGSWRSLPAKAGLERCGKSCRLRWTNYLRPDIKRGKLSSHEEKTIIRLHALLGNRWSAIAAHLPKRTDNEIKNYWNTRLKKRLTRMGIDPVTHKPKNIPGGSAQAANLSHMAQWETARLEAEARLARQSSKLLPPPNDNLLLQLHRKFNAPPPLPQPQRRNHHHLVAPPCLDVLRAWQATTAVPDYSFFSSAANLIDSPTSTLNFSCSRSTTLTVPTVGAAIIESDVMPTFNDYVACVSGEETGYADVEGKMENLMQRHDQNSNLAYPVDLYDCSSDMTASYDFAAADYNHNPSEMFSDSAAGGALVGEFDDSKNYWNELLNLVSSSPMPML